MGLKNYFTSGKIEVGCDEAGRGCLAGPVFAAAVILNPKKRYSKLDDSKKLSKRNRDEIRLWIEENALDWAVGRVEAEEIDQINILNASFLAMHRAIDQLHARFDQLLIDGNRFKPYAEMPHHCIIKGDGKYKAIAAASILAKTHRDEYMQKIAEDYPSYDWQNNQGYPTKKHRQAIIDHGKCVHHRNSFQLVPPQLKI
ncbi:MAG: ribonuclease HII, partial [Vicingaceae bacterium]